MRRLQYLIVIFFVLAGILTYSLLTYGKNKKLSADVQEEIKQPIPPEIITLTISGVGDIMSHMTQITSAYDKDTDFYDFQENYEYIKHYIEKADLAFANIETTFRGGPKYTGYPLFSAPDSLANNVKYAGFDVAITANNHMVDTGFIGMQRTLKVLRNAGLQTTGSRLKNETKDYSITKIGSVTVGIIAYTYESTRSAGKRSINGIPLSLETKNLINGFAYSPLTEELTPIKEDMQACRQDGADIVIVYIHWGDEYQRMPNHYQKTIAMELAKAGADGIFASHPHVLQPLEVLEIKSTDGEIRSVPVFYSMGNFISNQRAETLGNHYTEQGIIAQMSFEMSIPQESQEVEAITVIGVTPSYIPVWVDRYKEAGKIEYRLIPLDETINTNETLKLSGHGKRAEQALVEITELIGKEYLYKQSE